MNSSQMAICPYLSLILILKFSWLGWMQFYPLQFFWEWYKNILFQECLCTCGDVPVEQAICSFVAFYRESRKIHIYPILKNHSGWSVARIFVIATANCITVVIIMYFVFFYCILYVFKIIITCLYVLLFCSLTWRP